MIATSVTASLYMCTTLKLSKDAVNIAKNLSKSNCAPCHVRFGFGAATRAPYIDGAGWLRIKADYDLPFAMPNCQVASLISLVHGTAAGGENPFSVSSPPPSVTLLSAVTADNQKCQWKTAWIALACAE